MEWPHVQGINSFLSSIPWQKYVNLAFHVHMPRMYILAKKTSFLWEKNHMVSYEVSGIITILELVEKKNQPQERFNPNYDDGEKIYGLLLQLLND